jgi:hypothetical protein
MTGAITGADVKSVGYSLNATGTSGISITDYDEAVTTRRFFFILL